MLNSPRDPESHCCHQPSHPTVVNVFNAVLGAEVPLAGQHQHPWDSCVDAVGLLTAPQGEFPSCAYTQTRWVRLSPTTSSAEVPEVTSGLNLPFVLKHLWVLVWSWPELEEAFVEVSYCPRGALAGLDDIPLKTLPRVLCGSMLLHPHPDWALFQ